MKKVKSPEEYIESFDGWQRKALEKLRSIVTRSDANETIKWGTPCYTVDGKNVIGLAGFKSYVGVWFHQGALLSDPDKKLVSASDTTKALRQLRFHSDDEIDEQMVRRYVEEAIANQKAGKEIKPAKPKKEVIVPTELLDALKGNLKAKEEFEKLTPSKQREYCEHITSAKQDKTKSRRLEKILPMIEQGVGLNDRYK